MRADEVTGEVLDDEPEAETEAETNVRPLRPQRPAPRPGTRRTTVSGSAHMSSEDSKTMLAHSRTIEVEGASDRLGLSALKETLVSSEENRRLLTLDLIDEKARGEAEVERVRGEYDRAFNAMEARHAREASRARDERDRLQREIVRLENEAKDLKKAKKKHKKGVREAELKLEEMREAGLLRRTALTMVAPGVVPIASQIARHVPDLVAFARQAMGMPPAAPESAMDEEALRDREAAIRFAGNLFSPQNAELLEDLKRVAVNYIDDGVKAVIVDEWENVQRCVWSALLREAAKPPPDQKSEPTNAA